MRPLNLWRRVGPPTWKRSGTLVFGAVVGVLLVGGTAMAANLGLLASMAAHERGHRLDVPRPPLSVTLPATEPSPPVFDSTSVPAGADRDSDVASTPPKRSTPAGHRPGVETGDGERDGSGSTSDRTVGDGDDAWDADVVDDSSSAPQPDAVAGGRALAGGRAVDGEPADRGRSQAFGDGSLDDD